MPPLLLTALAVLVLYVVWDACRTKWQIIIEYEPELGTRTLGVPAAKKRAIQEFFDKNLAYPERIKILASRIPPDRLETKFIGRIEQGTKQRIRNYLIDSL